VFHRKVVEERTLAPFKVANLDFEARVPVPFSVFPSSYKDKESAEVETKKTKTHEEVEIKLPEKQAGREGQYSSAVSAQLPPRGEQRYSEEEVRFTREEERYRRPGVQQQHQQRQEYSSYEEHRRPQASYSSETSIHVDTQQKPYYSAVDNIEREYRSRVQPQYQESVRVTGTTVDPPAPRAEFSQQAFVAGTTVGAASARPAYTEQVKFTGTTVEPSKSVPSYQKDIKITEETVEYPRSTHSTSQKAKMGYYDEDGHYHSFRHGLHKVADKILPHAHHHHHHSHRDVEVVREVTTGAPAGPSGIPNTVTIPCHHIRNGDILMLQGRPCQVIRISTSAATGQYRYLGVDLFTKQLHEESSFISNPAPSVVVQTMLGPVLKQYRVLDLQDGRLVAMTESGEVKTNLPVLDQSSLWERTSAAFSSGRGSVRVLVLSDNGRELAVDTKTIHGTSL
jgi:hypothetical protein